MLQPRPAILPNPLATGSLASRPLAHLLVYALDRKLSGSFELADDHGALNAQIVVASGLVARVSTTAPVIYLGHVLYETGVIDTEQLSRSLAEVAATKRLHGQVLRALGFVDRAKLVAALAEQRSRKLQHALTLPPPTSFAFYSDVDVVGARPDDAPPMDPLPSVWIGVRTKPSLEHVRSTLATVAGRRLRVVKPFDRLALDPLQRAAVERLRRTPATVAELATWARLDVASADVLAYFLVIARIAEVVTGAEAAPTSPKKKVSDRGLASVSALPSGEYVRKISFAMRAVGADASAVRIPSPMPGRVVSPFPRPLAPAPEPAQPARSALDESSLAAAEQLLSKAEMHLVLGERESAVGLARQALTEAPGLPAALALLAYLEALGTKKGQESYLSDLLKMIDTALLKEDGCRRGRFCRAEIKKRLGDHEGAIRDLRAALRYDPDDGEAARELSLYERKVREGTVMVRSTSTTGGARQSGIVDWLRRNKPTE